MPAFSEWESFYVIVGSSAGALIGLQFVVITLMADTPTVRDMKRASSAFSTPNIVHFGAVLLLSAFVAAPWRGVDSRRRISGERWGWLECCTRLSSPAHARANRVQAGIRGLALSCPAAVRGIRDAGRIGLCVSLEYRKGTLRRWRDGAPAPLYRHS